MKKIILSASIVMFSMFGLSAISAVSLPSTASAQVADGIKDTIARYSCFTKIEVNKCRSNAEKLSRKALWSEFIIYYEQAYDIALKKAAARNK